MSNIYFDAADAIKRAAKQYEIFVAAAQALEQAGSFEQAAKESAAASQQAKIELYNATKDLQEVKAQIKDERSKAKQLADDAARKAAALLADAQVKAEEAARKVRADADAYAASVQADAMAARKAFDAELVTVKDEIARGAQALKAQQAQVKDLADQRDALLAEISAIRAKFA